MSKPQGPGPDADPDKSNRSEVRIEPAERRSPDLEGGNRSMDPEDQTLEDVMESERSRPDLPDETADGLDDMDEEVRRQAEDLPIDAPGRE